MSQKPDIEKIRVLHDLRTQFDVPPALREELESQLAQSDQAVIERFVGGFTIEDWFEWTFSAIPWVKLIHGLDQQQLPERSKELYQVPDFMMLVETSRHEDQPLLVEVKRVPVQKATLKLQAAQVDLCERYAATLRIPLVYVVYWEKFSAWTLTTPDAFERGASARRLPVTSAFERDCGLILGDISYVVPPALTRVSRYHSQGEVPEDSSGHKKHGRRVFDMASLGTTRVEMNELESAAVDSMLTMTQVSSTRREAGETELVERPDNLHLLKLSSWINRHLAIFGMQPTEERAHVSAHVITDFMEKLGCPPARLFPANRSPQMQALAELFLTPDDEHSTPSGGASAGPAGPESPPRYIHPAMETTRLALRQGRTALSIITLRAKTQSIRLNA